MIIGVTHEENYIGSINIGGYKQINIRRCNRSNIQYQLENTLTLTLEAMIRGIIRGIDGSSIDGSIDGSIDSGQNS